MLIAELDSPLIQKLEASTAVATVVTPGYVSLDTSAVTVPALRYHGDFDQFVPMIAVGNPNGVPPVSVASRTDPNVPTSPFAGVVSLSVGGFICSGAMLTSTHVVTAAHCLDLDDDGSVDLTPGEVTVFFNEDNPNSNSSGATAIGASALINHPAYTGFLEPSLNDDIAVVTLSSPAPPGVPIYPIHTDPFTDSTQIVLAGYGTQGDAINGETGGPSFFVKLTGQNVASQFELDDEGSGIREVWVADFDGPAPADSFGDGTTLGNDIEITILGGDSGGPSFIWTDGNSNTTIEQGELTWWGNNTFGSTFAPDFNTDFGGMVGAAYLPFLESVFNDEPIDPPPEDPDDQIAEASLLGLPANVSGNISGGLDVDMYALTATAGQRLGIDIDVPLGSLDSGLRLFDSSGTELLFSDDDAGPTPETSTLESYIEYMFPNDGTFYIGVSSFSNFSYDAATGTGDADGASSGDYQLIINQLNTGPSSPPGATVPFTEDFESFVGSGFLPEPTSGQLDSDFWRVTGMADGNGTFEGTHVTGDFARGSSAGGVSTGGVYALNTGSNVILGFQPSGSDFTPGTVTLKVSNETGEAISAWDISYDIFALNNENRSSSLNLEYSTDDVTYISLAASNYITPATAQTPATWTATARNLAFSGVTIADGGALFLRWVSDDIGGSGSRDEFGIDNIRVEAQTQLSGLNIEPTSISENGGVAIGTVTRSGNTNGDFLVTLLSDDQTGAIVPATVIIFDGQAEATFPISAVDDSAIDGTQSVTITASAPGMPGVTATIDVIDDEQPPSVSLSVDPTEISENGGITTVTALLSEVSNLDVQISLGLTGTATASVDYLASATQINIPAGSLSGMVAITAIDNSEVANDKVVFVDIDSVTNADEIDQQQVVVSIRDDDSPADTIAPTITAVYASSLTPWSSTFIDAVDGGGVGAGNGIGIELTAGLLIPNSGIDLFTIQFSEDVIGFDATSVVLFGVNTPDYASIATVNYNPSTFVGTIELSTPILLDKLRLAIDDTAVTDAALNELDGDGSGGIYDLRVDIIVGDANDDGSVNGGDLSAFAAAFNASFGQPTFNAAADWNSDGSVNGGDLSLFAGNFNQSLPTAEPADASFASALSGFASSADAFFKSLELLDDEDEDPIANNMLF